jgi:hypothetical protein
MQPTIKTMEDTMMKTLKITFMLAAFLASGSPVVFGQWGLQTLEQQTRSD